ncbi:hypothetical protein PTKIN_Ptkin02bG0042400 [Pterospermum kingtungense]
MQSKLEMVGISESVKALKTEDTTVSWRNLFTATDQSLHYSPLRVLNGRSLVAPPKETFKKGWEMERCCGCVVYWESPKFQSIPKGDQDDLGF